MAKKKKKRASAELTLWDVVLSFPDLHDPKPYKGKVYYRTDMLLEQDHSQLGELKALLKQVRVEAFGPDKAEWPEGATKVFIQNGNDREDQAAYKDKLFVSAATQTPVPVVDLKGKSFNPQSVKGGMFANVAIRIAAWEFDGDEGISIYLQGVQIDTSKASLNFGGGKSVSDMFNRKKPSPADGDDADETDEDETPTPKKKAKKPVDEDDEDTTDGDDEDDLPKSKKRKHSEDEEE